MLRLVLLFLAVHCMSQVAYVTSNNSATSTACSLLDPCSLDTALASAAPTLALLPGRFSRPSNAPLNVRRSVSFTRADLLAPVFLDPNNLQAGSFFFDLQCSTSFSVSFSGLIAENFMHGVIRATTMPSLCVVQVSNCVFRNGESTPAIDILNQNLILRDSTFEHNNSTVSTATVRLFANVSAIISGCLFSNNSGVQGGAIHIAEGLFVLNILHYRLCV